MNAIEFLLGQHSHAHTSDPPVAFDLQRVLAETEAEMSVADWVFGGLTEAQMRVSPAPNLNPLAWIVWHMAREEDVCINTVLVGEPQVFDRDHWPQRLGIDRRDMGTGMSYDEVVAFSKTVDVPAVLAYRVAVGCQTRSALPGMTNEDLCATVDRSRTDRAEAEGAFAGRAGRVVKQFYTGKSKAFYLRWAATSHNFLHLGEALTVRSQGGFPLAV